MKIDLRHLMGVPLMTLMLVSCGDDDNPVKNAADEVKESVTRNIELQETWTGNCSDSDILDASVRRSWIFDGSQFTERQEVFSDDNCTSLEGTVKMTGDFDVEGGDDTKDLNLHYKEMTIKLENETAVGLFDAVDFCGVEEWEVGREIRVASVSGDKCFISEIPTDRYGKVRVDDGEDRLYLSKEFAERPEERPQAISEEEVYFDRD